MDQSPLGGNARSTVGTISNLYSSLRLLFSRVGQPYAGTASFFSFNDPSGMCKTCSGLGRVTKIDIDAIFDLEKSWNEGCVKDPTYKPDCRGKRLNEAALDCRINGHSIADMCGMELTELREVLSQLADKTVDIRVQTLIEGLDRLIEIGLPYLHLNRESATLSGGEAQRLKLVRYMGSSLTGMTYIWFACQKPKFSMLDLNA